VLHDGRGTVHHTEPTEKGKSRVRPNTPRVRPGLTIRGSSGTAIPNVLFAALLLVSLAGLVSGILAAVLPAPALAVPSTSTTLVLRGEVKNKVDELEDQAGVVQADINALDVELERLTESYNRLNVDLETLNQDLTSLRRRLRESESLHQARQARLDKRLAETYKSENSGASSLIALLLITEDLSDFLERLFLITKVNIQDQILVEKVRASGDDMNEIAAQIEAKKSEALAVRRELDEKRAQIEGLLSERRSVLEGLDSRIAALIEQERARQEAERLRLEAEFRARLTGWERYDGPLPHIDDALLNQVVETAAAYLGVPYVWGGERPSIGLDCSGLLQYIYRQHGVNLPHYSGYQAQMGIPVPASEIAPGDLIAFGSPVHHVGMYIGDGLFIHAPRTGDVVRITPLSTRRDVATIRRFPVQGRAGAPKID